MDTDFPQIGYCINLCLICGNLCNRWFFCIFYNHRWPQTLHRKETVLICAYSVAICVIGGFLCIFLIYHRWPQMATDFSQKGNCIFLCLICGDLCNRWFFCIFYNHRWPRMATDFSQKGNCINLCLICGYLCNRWFSLYFFNFHRWPQTFHGNELVLIGVPYAVYPHYTQVNA